MNSIAIFETRSLSTTETPKSTTAASSVFLRSDIASRKRGPVVESDQSQNEMYCAEETEIKKVSHSAVGSLC